jgi:hypothetical protein
MLSNGSHLHHHRNGASPHLHTPPRPPDPNAGALPVPARGLFVIRVKTPDGNEHEVSRQAPTQMQACADAELLRQGIAAGWTASLRYPSWVREVRTALLADGIPARHCAVAVFERVSGEEVYSVGGYREVTATLVAA